ncbi:ROK family transcriptional regulator [Nocardioides silvaticus]|uniref:ROK family transcriptional regulator n=1 Tax=Nocardioides silvaticus TaxID=2201891 RepID=UPI001304DE73|nr:ROK family transcriptional regulator [Nocardioides silvaticus]
MSRPVEPGGAESLRRRNAAAVVRALREGGPGSRADLAARTGLAKATVGTIVGGLEERGVVRDLEQVRSGERGRPGQLVTLEDGRPVGVGFEVNVAYVAAVVLDLGGVVRREVTRPVANDGDVLTALAATATELAADLDASGLRPLGATVALPGLVGGDDRTAVWVPNLDLAGRGLVDAVDAAFGWTGRARASNDADCSALAELHLGAGRGADHLLYLTGTVGIGAGMIESRRLLRGARGFAGEVGHLPIGEAGAACGCGRTGCWEASVGLHALLAAVGLPEAGTPHETAAEVARAAESSAEVRDGIASVGRWLGRGLAVVTGILDPGAVVLGGYFVPLGDLILEPAADELVRTLASGELGPPDLRLGRLGTASAACGAAERALEETFAGAVDLLA